MKRIASLFLSLMLAISMIPALAYAESETAAMSEPVDSGVPQITVSVKGAGLYAEWTASDGADSYEIYRSYQADSKWTLLKKGITDCSYQDMKVASGKRAYYKVRACNADGSYSDYSDTAAGPWMSRGP